MDLFETLWEDNFSVEKAAILIALTQTRAQEEAVKSVLTQKGFKVAATTISGDDSIVRKKAVNAVVGACLNGNVLEKNKKSIHAAVHATHEACLGGKLGSVINQNYQLKAGIASNGDWLSVCFYGDIAIHEFSDHKTISIGVMHL